MRKNSFTNRYISNTQWSHTNCSNKKNAVSQYSGILLGQVTKRTIFNGIILSRKCSKDGKERIRKQKFSRCEHQRAIFLQEHSIISLPGQVHQFPHKENLLSLLALTSHIYNMIFNMQVKQSSTHLLPWL